jgi:hypothetical protein
MRAYLSAAAAVALIGFATAGVGSDVPAIVQRMTEAHGGMERWAQVSAVHLDHILYMSLLPADQDRWWVASQTVETEGARRSYQRYPKHHAKMAYDGERVWSVGWGEANPPSFMVYFDYYFAFLPWLAQRDDVILGEPETGRLPDDPTDYATVRMTFAPGRAPIGKTERDYFKLYIDPNSNRLKAVEYAMAYPPFLALMGMGPDQAFGPLTHVYDEWVTVDGLTVPRRYHTLGPDGGFAGDHIVVNYRFDEPLDPSLLEMPPDAVVDSNR